MFDHRERRAAQACATAVPPAGVTGTSGDVMGPIVSRGPDAGPVARLAPMPTTALFTDHYELTMVQAAMGSQTAFRQSVFELFPRRLPDGLRYGVVLVEDGEVQDLVDVIVTSARTGEPGDGKVWVTAVENTVRVSTGELGDVAL